MWQRVRRQPEPTDAAGCVEAELVCSNGQSIGEVLKWVGEPGGPRLVSSPPEKQTIFHPVQHGRAGRTSLSPEGRRSRKAPIDDFWTLTILSHSKEVSSEPKYVLKVKHNATVGDVCVAFMDALASSGGSIVIQSKSANTTGFALYSTRKMAGVPINIAGQMSVSLSLVLGQGQSGPGTCTKKAILHVFPAQCADHWNVLKGNLCGSTLHEAALRIIGGLGGEPTAGHHADTNCPSWDSHGSRSENRAGEENRAGAREEFRVIRSFAARSRSSRVDGVDRGVDRGTAPTVQAGPS